MFLLVEGLPIDTHPRQGLGGTPVTFEPWRFGLSGRLIFLDQINSAISGLNQISSLESKHAIHRSWRAA
jgi:hypothetical protein